tara:strand:+ start:3014 stop:3187 length:174 start_codon:yes stop_codon:yes gene_type:complete
MARLPKKKTKKYTAKDAALLAKGLKKVGGKILVNENYKRGKDKALDKVILDALIDKI